MQTLYIDLLSQLQQKEDLDITSTWFTWLVWHVACLSCPFIQRRAERWRLNTILQSARQELQGGVVEVCFGRNDEDE